jgi:hypothetical protein
VRPEGAGRLQRAPETMELARPHANAEPGCEPLGERGHDRQAGCDTLAFGDGVSYRQG